MHVIYTHTQNLHQHQKENPLRIHIQRLFESLHIHLFKIKGPVYHHPTFQVDHTTPILSQLVPYYSTFDYNMSPTFPPLTAISNGASFVSHRILSSLQQPPQAPEPTPEDLEKIPRWQRFVVQWDISHMAASLAFFAFTAVVQTASSNIDRIVIPMSLWYTLYFVSCTILFISALIYFIRAVIYPAAVASDFHHPRFMNFFFLPVMIGALCILTTPPALRSLLQFRIGFYVLAAYQIILALYFNGDWLFGAHPTGFIHPLVFMQTIGYFLTANIAAFAHLVDQGYAMLSVGLLFWLLVFITNFQHLSPALQKRSERPQPTFFLFVAPPAQAALSLVLLSIAESQENKTTLLQINPSTLSFPRLAQSMLYIDLFLYMLVLRLFPTFWTGKFAVTWWAYIFPLSAAATATMWNYKAERSTFWAIIAWGCTIIACFAMLVVSIFMGGSLLRGQTPNNPNSLKDYYRYWSRRNLPPSDEYTEP